MAVTEVHPHLVVAGADRAAAFYAAAFGARELRRIPVPDGRLMSVQLQLGPVVLHLADEFPEMGVVAPATIGGTASVLQLQTDDVDALFRAAVDAGAEALSEPADAFWGERHAQLRDPFGHRWNLATTQREVPDDELVREAAKLFG